MIKPVYNPRVVNALCWAAYTVLAAMLGLVLWGVLSTHGWHWLWAAPAIMAVTVWLLRRPLMLLAIWLGLRL